jgi:hypothetical protein
MNSYIVATDGEYLYPESVSSEGGMTGNLLLSIHKQGSISS